MMRPAADCWQPGVTAPCITNGVLFDGDKYHVQNMCKRETLGSSELLPILIIDVRKGNIKGIWMNMDGYIYIYGSSFPNLSSTLGPGDAHFPKEAKPIGRRNLFALETVKYRWDGMVTFFSLGRYLPNIPSGKVTLM